MKKEHTADEIIDALGGTSETARLCEVQPPSVSDWRKDGIPHARLMFLRLARPDVFALLGRGVPVDQIAQGHRAVDEPNSPAARRATDPEPAPGRAGRQPIKRSTLELAADQPPLYTKTAKTA